MIGLELHSTLELQEIYMAYFFLEFGKISTIRNLFDISLNIKDFFLMKKS